jgi:hypothetical protein
VLEGVCEMPLEQLPHIGRAGIVGTDLTENHDQKLIKLCPMVVAREKSDVDVGQRDRDDRGVVFE